jgi:D-inositol-3-phosphate glycosyltransferase
VLVDGHQVGPWTDAVEALLHDRTRRLALGQRAVEHASRYGWAATTDRLVEVYRQAIRGRQASGNDSPIDEGRALAGVPPAVIP